MGRPVCRNCVTPVNGDHGRESEVGISVARLLLGLIVRLAECPVSSADSSVGMTALGQSRPGRASSKSSHVRYAAESGGKFRALAATL
jgi:hypothetical protein